MKIAGRSLISVSALLLLLCLTTGFYSFAQVEAGSSDSETADASSLTGINFNEIEALPTPSSMWTTM